jgi:type IV secretory pathway ATPase VirB11/archaellum biosynthesis ATPase
MLIELFGGSPNHPLLSYESYPFAYSVCEGRNGSLYSIQLLVPRKTLQKLREVVAKVSEDLDPATVEPLTFRRLVEVLRQLAAKGLATSELGDRVKDISELVAYEAMGLSRVLALAKDQFVTEFYVDSDESTLYLDHSNVGRCETSIALTERERKAIETHIDTFKGYTLDYTTPSLKNDLEIADARLRISLDLEPISVNRFSLDVRRLSITSLSLPQLIGMNVICPEAAAFLVVWLELGGNVTIIGETGTGKTTLLNALDEALNPKLRRVYIEDAVETRDMLKRGYHQMKIKVDPFERNEDYVRTKGTEIVKVLHRSPDIVILSEIQSEEHSKAFFHALSAGIRGMQTFHASSIEQAVRRWTSVHGVPKQNILDLGLLVQMTRPDRLKPFRAVSRICEILGETGEPRLRDVYDRDRDFLLQRITTWERISPPEGRKQEELSKRISERVAEFDGELIAK